MGEREVDFIATRQKEKNTNTTSTISEATKRSNDPGETKNAADDPDNADILETMREQLAAQRHIHSELSLV